MIKVDIVSQVSKVADIDKDKAEVAVDAVLDVMRLSMQRGERVELRGYGVVQVIPRTKGVGQNPRVVKPVRNRTMRFKAGKPEAKLKATPDPGMQVIADLYSKL